MHGSMRIFSASIAAALALVVAACDEPRTSEVVKPPTAVPSTTTETNWLATAVGLYGRAPNSRSWVAVREALGEVDAKIEELTLYMSRVEGMERAEALARLQTLRDVRQAQVERFS